MTYQKPSNCKMNTCSNLQIPDDWKCKCSSSILRQVSALSTGWKLISNHLLNTGFDSLWLYSPWNSPGQNTAVGGLSLLQGIFPTQESNPGLLHCGLSYQGSPRKLEWVAYPFSSWSSRSRNRLGSPALQADSLPTVLRGNPCSTNDEAFNTLPSAELEWRHSTGKALKWTEVRSSRPDQPLASDLSIMISPSFHSLSCKTGWMDESHPSKSEPLCCFLHRAGADFHLLLDTNAARSDYDRMLPMSWTSHRPGSATNINHPMVLTVLQASPTAEQIFSPMRQRVPFRNGTAVLGISEDNQREDWTPACGLTVGVTLLTRPSWDLEHKLQLTAERLSGQLWLPPTYRPFRPRSHTADSRDASANWKACLSTKRRDT